MCDAESTLGSAESDAPDGTQYPWAQDFDGTWHLRPADDAWGGRGGDVQAHGLCGSEFGSVHVSTFRPIPEPGLDERLCSDCVRLAPPAETEEDA